MQRPNPAALRRSRKTMPGVRFRNAISKSIRMQASIMGARVLRLLQVHIELIIWRRGEALVRLSLESIGQLWTFTTDMAPRASRASLHGSFRRHTFFQADCRAAVGLYLLSLAPTGICPPRHRLPSQGSVRLVALHCDIALDFVRANFSACLFDIVFSGSIMQLRGRARDMGQVNLRGALIRAFLGSLPTLSQQWLAPSAKHIVKCEGQCMPRS